MVVLQLPSQDKGRPLPKFGEWDVNNPASAEGFTVIFNRARDEKKTNGNTPGTASPQRNDKQNQYPPMVLRSGFVVVKESTLPLSPEGGGTSNGGGIIPVSTSKMSPCE
ncbi:Pathogenic type III effector avirulence factor Avr cleavage site [Macleaya cordata]|uniref:Pathogenic type III effector avirulence factor Avr cleavage site n=1 Tax=Macleaya cordata TaxID=56857 RepID=A0A200R4E8_MACCD|nr:Pathogenic type III effector avirulence factor Avr cleavage site [Macleaya cordata]